MMIGNDGETNRLSPTDQMKSFIEKEQLSEAWSLLNSWLNDESSDTARKWLQEIPDFDLIDDLDRRNLRITLEELLNQPFFNILGLPPLPTKEEEHKYDKRLSGDVSQSGRQVLTGYYAYNIRFKEWESFEDDIIAAGVPDPNDQNSRHWARLRRDSLSRSFAAKQISQGEIQELVDIRNQTQDILNLFGFEIDVKNGDRDDFSFRSTEDKTDFLVGKGTESSKLPRMSFHGAHMLCLVGFATKVARTKASMSAEEAGRAELVKLLELREYEPEKTDANPSEMTKSLLNLGEAITDVAKNVKAMLFEGNIENQDPVKLWAAVVQACHYTLPANKRFSMVMSARMIWFLRLDVDQGKCYVVISRAYPVGRESFLKKVISFLNLAKSAAPMPEHSRRTWQNALSLKKKSKKDRGGKSDSDSTRQKAKKKKPNSSQGQGGSKSNVASLQIGTTEITPTQVVSMCEDYQYRDSYGIVPYFDQISEPLETLGAGRCGAVTRVKWQGIDVALKAYELQDDDERYFYDVYEYELDVLAELEKLWGSHVPYLLFHQSWRTHPMIGLQMGEPIREDDMSLWEQGDLKNANDTISKVKALGWEQRDLRGSNFVRLTGPDGVGRIAMIDFEDMVRTNAGVGSSNQGSSFGSESAESGVTGIAVTT